MLQITQWPADEVAYNIAMGMIQKGLVITCAQDIIDTLEKEYPLGSTVTIGSIEEGCRIEIKRHNDGSMTVCQENTKENIEKTLSVVTNNGYKLDFTNTDGIGSGLLA